MKNESKENKFLKLIKSNIFNCITFLVGEIAVIISSILLKSSALSICFSVMTLMYVFSSTLKLWLTPIAGLITVALYIPLCVITHNYGELIFNAAVVIPLLIFGIVQYIQNRKKSDAQIKENHLSYKEILILLACDLALCIGLFFLLRYLNTPYIFMAVGGIFVAVCSNYFLVRRDMRMYFLFTLNNICGTLLWLMPVIYGESFGVSLIPVAISFFVQIVFNSYCSVRYILERKKEKKNKENSTEISIENPIENQNDEINKID